MVAAAGATECRLVDSTLTFTGAPEPELTELFTSYGDAAGEWTGGDSTYSIPMRDGDNVWVFSDTFLGEVADDGSRPLDSPFLNNSFVVQGPARPPRDRHRAHRWAPSSSGPPTDEAGGLVMDGTACGHGDSRHRQLVAL